MGNAELWLGTSGTYLKPRLYGGSADYTKADLCPNGIGDGPVSPITSAV